MAKKKIDQPVLNLEVVGIIGGVHNSLPVDIEPDITLTRWAIYEGLSDMWGEGQRNRHFVGDCGEGRASTPIVEFNKEAMIGKTRSGRTYHLKGNPGLTMDAGYVWGVFVEINKITDIKEVTNEYV